jgi:hypothetical protein
MLKIAVTLRALVTVMVQLKPKLKSQPRHPVNTEPGAGVAVRVTGVS